MRFLLANATLFLDQILDSYPAPIDLITIQYPDPQFKRRHRKRRIVQPSLVDAAARRLAPGGRVLLQSDVLEVGAEWVAGKVGGNSFRACSSPEYSIGHVPIQNILQFINFPCNKLQVAEDMRDHFAANSAFELESGHGEPGAVFFHASTNGIEKNSDMEQDTSKGIKSPRFRDGGWLHNNPLVCVKVGFGGREPPVLISFSIKGCLAEATGTTLKCACFTAGCVYERPNAPLYIAADGSHGAGGPDAGKGRPGVPGACGETGRPIASLTSARSCLAQGLHSFYIFLKSED